MRALRLVRYKDCGLADRWEAWLRELGYQYTWVDASELPFRHPPQKLPALYLDNMQIESISTDRGAFRQKLIYLMHELERIYGVS